MFVDLWWRVAGGRQLRLLRGRGGRGRLSGQWGRWSGRGRSTPCPIRCSWNRHAGHWWSGRHAGHHRSGGHTGHHRGGGHTGHHRGGG
ncbi:MAG TPA: hypothetical protein DER64_03005, partial [Planctomycetaceae bacterium]|nr:hypothetical protein [Planctomycetaceae bacterium]